MSLHVRPVHYDFAFDQLFSYCLPLFTLLLAYTHILCIVVVLHLAAAAIIILQCAIAMDGPGAWIILTITNALNPKP